jgi:hypothetical protein
MPEGHTAEMSCGNQLAAEAFVVCASEKDAVTIALGVTLANNDVAVAVNLCGVHDQDPFTMRLINGREMRVPDTIEAKNCCSSISESENARAAFNVPNVFT